MLEEVTDPDQLRAVVLREFRDEFRMSSVAASFV